MNRIPTDSVCSLARGHMIRVLLKMVDLSLGVPCDQKSSRNKFKLLNIIVSLLLFGLS